MGEFEDAAFHVGVSISILKEYYSESDIELSMELFKYAQLLFNAGKSNEARNAAIEARSALLVTCNQR